jgi:hypothetical protein
MEKSRYRGLMGVRSPSRRGVRVVVTGLVLGLLAACGDDGAGGTPGGAGSAGSAGSAGAAGAGRGGSSGAGGRGGAASGGDGNAAGESGTAGESGEGGAGAAGRGQGEAGAPEGGAPDSGGTSGVAGHAGDAAGAGAGGLEEGVLGAKGGRVSDAGGDITLSIPPGALRGETRFSFAELGALSSVPDGYVTLAGTLHEISWSGAGFTTNAVVTVGIRAPETLALEHVGLAPEALLAPSPPSLPISGVSVCEGSASNYNVQPGKNSYEGQVMPSCNGNGGSGGASGGGSPPIQVGLATPQPSRFPSITRHPAGLSVAAGYDVSFSVAAVGEAPLAYQWYRDGVAISAATSAGYRLGPASVADHAALFTVTISNRFGTLTSAAAQLFVEFPAAPRWDGQRAVLRDFSTGLGVPEVSTLLWLNGFAAWNDGASIEIAGSNYGPVEGLSVPARSAPLVLALSSGGYVVYVDDDGTSTCTGTTGNRLMAVGISTHQNQVPVPNSAPFVLYQSQGDCISAFTASLADPNPALLPDPLNHNPDIRIVPIVYALTELGTGQLKAGTGGAGVATCGFCSDMTWEYAQSLPLTLPVESACSGPARLGADGSMGRFQSHLDTQIPAATTAVLAWVSGENLCAATLDGHLWSEGRVVFDHVAAEVTPVAALDNAGNAFVAASRVDAPGSPYATYRMSTGYRADGSNSWEFHELDFGSAPATPSTAFTPSGDALIAWVSTVEAPQVLAIRRTRAGTWDFSMEVLSEFDAVAVGTGRPRLCIDNRGAALALFQQTKNDDMPLQIWGKQWVAGFWGSASVAQDNTYAGSDASCVRHLRSAFTRADPLRFSPGFVAWREVDPETPSVSRIAAHGAAL